MVVEIHLGALLSYGVFGESLFQYDPEILSQPIAHPHSVLL